VSGGTARSCVSTTAPPLQEWRLNGLWPIASSPLRSPGGGSWNRLRRPFDTARVSSPYTSRMAPPDDGPTSGAASNATSWCRSLRPTSFRSTVPWVPVPTARASEGSSISTRISWSRMDPSPSRREPSVPLLCRRRRWKGRISFDSAGGAGFPSMSRGRPWRRHTERRSWRAPKITTGSRAFSDGCRARVTRCT